MGIGAVTITPVSGQTGTATITLTVTDGGGLTSSRTFVSDGEPAADTAPTISTIVESDGDDGSIDDERTRHYGWRCRDPCCEFADGDRFVVEHEFGRLVGHRVWWFGREPDGDDHAGERSDRHNAPITLTVTDGGGLTATSTFVVTVNPPPNTAPTISTVANQTVTTGQSTSAYSHYGWRCRDSAVGSLTVTGSSSNTDLVASSGIVFGGSGARTGR